LYNVVLLCSNWSLKKLFSRVGQRKKSRVAKATSDFCEKKN
jgi:hypothetical protein